MSYKHIELFKATLVEQYVNSFACSQFTFGVLSLNSLLTSAQFCLFSFVKQLLDFFFKSHYRLFYYLLTLLLAAKLGQNAPCGLRMQETNLQAFCTAS